MNIAKKPGAKPRTSRKPPRTKEQILQDNKDRYFNKRLARFVSGVTSKVEKKHPDIQVEYSLGTTQVKQTFIKHARGKNVRKKVLSTVPELTLDFITVDPQTLARHRVMRAKGPLDYRWDDHKALDFRFPLSRGHKHADRQISVDLHFNAAATYVAEMVEERLDNPTKRITRKSEKAPHTADDTSLPSIPLEEMDKDVVRAFKRLETNFRNRYSITRPIFKNVNFHYHPIHRTIKAHFVVLDEHRNGDPEFDIFGTVKIEQGRRPRIMFKITSGLLFKGLESDPFHISEHDKTGNVSMALYELIENSGFLRNTAQHFARKLRDYEMTPEQRRKHRREKDIEDKMAPRFNRRGRPVSRPNNRVDAALEFGRGDFGRRDDVRNKFKTRRRAEKERELMGGNFDSTSDEYARPIPPGAYKPSVRIPRYLLNH